MEETRLSVTPLLPHLGQLADLHVYVVPVECWASSQKLLCSFVMQEAVSYGFVRVHTKVILHDLRSELEEQLEKDVLPEEYVFLKSVGRNFARVKEKQEYQLKVRDFVPPNASEPELYLLEIIPEVEGNQSDKLLNRGRMRCGLASPSRLPTLKSPVNDLSAPSAVLRGSPTTTLLPPVSSGAKAARVSSKNRATSSTGLVAVDSEVKLPSIQLERPKSESHVKNGGELKTSSKKLIPRTQSVVPPPPPSFAPPIPPPLPSHLPSRIPVPRSRTGKGTATGRRVSVTANVLKRRRYSGNGRPSAIIAYQRIIVPNGRRMVARGTALSDVAEESEGGEPPLTPMRVEGPESLKQRTCYANKYKAIQKVFDSSQESTDEEIRKLEVETLPMVPLEDPKSEEEETARTHWQDKEEEQPVQEESDDMTVANQRRILRRKVSSSGALRPVSNLDIRSAQQAAILKYELTVNELKGLRHAACHTSEQTNRPIMYRHIRPIQRTVWYPRPLHEGGNPPPVLRQTTYRRGGRRSKAVRGDAGHAYYTLSNDRRRTDRPHVTFGTRISKKKTKPMSHQGLKTKPAKALPAFQVISAISSLEEEGNRRVPYSKSKRRRKKVLKPETEEESGSGKEIEKEKEKVLDQEPKVAVACEKSGSGCCDWVIDSVSLEEFVNSEEKRKQVLQPIRKAAQARRKQVEMEAKGKYSASTSEVPQGTVLLCSVDRPH